MQVRTAEIPLSIWEQFGALVVRYRAKFPRKTIKAIRKEKFRRLNETISGEWHTAEELAEMAGIECYAAVKFLQTMIRAEKVRYKEVIFIDHKYRKRKKLYYASIPVESKLINEILGMKVPDVPCGLLNTRIHRMGK